jgi:tetratricopeptide (TPR) repeat protein
MLKQLVAFMGAFRFFLRLRVCPTSAFLLLLSALFAGLSIAAFGQAACNPGAPTRLSSADLPAPSTPEEKRVAVDLDQGAQALQRGNEPEGQKLQLAALALAENLPDWSAWKSRALWAASLAYQRHHDFRQSIALAKRAASLDEEALGQEAAALDSTQLALRYRMAGDLKEASRLYDNALVSANAADNISCYELVTVLQQVASFYSQQKRFPEAERLMRQALDSAAEVPASKGYVLMAARQTLVGILRAEGKNDKAEQLLSQPLPSPLPDPAQRQPTTRAMLESNPDLSVALNDLNLAREAMEQGKLRDAESFYQSAIPPLEAAPPQLALMSLSGALEGLGEVCHRQGRDAEAEQLFLRALSLREKTAADGVSAALHMLSSPFTLQNFFRDQKRLSEMEPVYQRAIKLQEKYLDPHDPSLGLTWYHYATLYVDEGKLEDSLPMFQGALLITENDFGKTDRRLLPILEDYSGALLRLGRAQEARTLETRAAAIRESVAAAAKH